MKMEKQKIDVYIDNLDVNTQADLLKKVLFLLIRARDNFYDNFENEVQFLYSSEVEEINFIKKQIEEFNENYTKQELKQFHT